MSEHNNDQCSECKGKNLLEFHLFGGYLLCKKNKPQMQSNPLRSFEDPRVDAVYRLVKGRVDLKSLIPTCLEIASEIEQMNELKGPQKLALLQDVLRLAIQDSKLRDEEKSKILTMVDTVVPIAIQAAILASKSPILKKVQATCFSCCTKTV